MHGLRHPLAVGHSLHHCPGTAGRIARGEHAGPGGMAVLVHGQKPAAAGVDAFGRADQVALRALAYRDDDPRAGIELLGTLHRLHAAVRIDLAVGENHAVLPDLHGALVVDEVHTLQLCIAALVLAGREGVRQVHAGYVPCALPHSGPCAVHGTVAGADHHDPLAEAERGRAGQVVDRIRHMAQALAPDVQLPRLPESCAHEHALVSVPEQVIDGDGAADVGVGSELDALQLQMAVGQVIQHGVRQAEVRNPVPQHAAHLVTAVKDRHLIAVACQNDGDRDARRPCADHGSLSPVGRSRSLHHLVCIGGGDVALDHREVHRHVLDAPHAVPFALLLMVAHQRTDRGEGIVFKEHPARIIEPALPQQPDDLGNVGLDGAALPAPWIFALKTAVRFFHHMKSHGILLHSFKGGLMRKVYGPVGRQTSESAGTAPKAS